VTSYGGCSSHRLQRRGAQGYQLSLHGEGDFELAFHGSDHQVERVSLDVLGRDLWTPRESGDYCQRMAGGKYNTVIAFAFLP